MHTSIYFTTALLAVAAISLDMQPTNAAPVNVDVPLLSWRFKLNTDSYKDEERGRGMAGRWSLANQRGSGIHGNFNGNFLRANKTASWNSGLQVGRTAGSQWEGKLNAQASLHNGTFTKSVDVNSRVRSPERVDGEAHLSAVGQVGRVGDGLGVSGEGGLDTRLDVAPKAKPVAVPSKSDTDAKSETESLYSAESKSSADSPRGFHFGGKIHANGAAVAEPGTIKANVKAETSSELQAGAKQIKTEAEAGGSAHVGLGLQGLTAGAKVEGSADADMNGRKTHWDGETSVGGRMDVHDRTLLTNAHATTEGSIEAGNIDANIKTNINSQGQVGLKEEGLVALGSTTGVTGVNVNGVPTNVMGGVGAGANLYAGKQGVKAGVMGDVVASKQHGDDITDTGMGAYAHAWVGPEGVSGKVGRN